MNKELRKAAIVALLNVMQDDAKEIARSTAEAATLMNEGNQDGAIGELLIVEAQLERLRNFRTILSLHRDA